MYAGEMQCQFQAIARSVNFYASRLNAKGEAQVQTNIIFPASIQSIFVVLQGADETRVYIVWG